MEYVVAAANLYGHIYGIQGPRDEASIRTILETVQVPSFTPSSSVTIHLTDTEMQESRENESDDAGELLPLAFISCYYLTSSQDIFIYYLCLFAPEKARLDELKGKLASPALKSSAARMYPIDFEKVGPECSDRCPRHSGSWALAGSDSQVYGRFQSMSFLWGGGGGGG